MPKEMSLENLVKDLNYIVFPTYVHEFLFRVFPPKPGVKILEPGCGSAKFSISYALCGCSVRAFDIDISAVDYARLLQTAIEILRQKNLDCAIGPGNVFEMCWPDNNFDLVFNEGVAQHWTDERRQKCIDEMVRVTKRGGTVVIVGNNGLNPEEKQIDETFEFKYEGMPPHRQCFTPGELKLCMERAGLENVFVNPLDFGRARESGGKLMLPMWSTSTLLGGYGTKK